MTLNIYEAGGGDYQCLSVIPISRVQPLAALVYILNQQKMAEPPPRLSIKLAADQKTPERGDRPPGKRGN